MMMDRREFLKTGGLVTAGAACAYGWPVLTAGAASEEDRAGEGDVLWGMVIDLTKCQADCTACLSACRKENNIYVHGDERWDVQLIRKVRIQRDLKDLGIPFDAAEQSVPLLCNHCDRAPCVQACPVQAAYKREDGIVICDQHRCIGCRYCMIACPYNAKFFNYKESPEDFWPNKERAKSAHGVTEGCTFCAHRLDRGEPAACVEACRKAGHGAMALGNLKDPDSEVAKLIANNPVQGIREDLGTKPKVYYIGL